MQAKKYSVYVFEVADYGFSVRFDEFKIADPIWLPCCHTISIKLLEKSLSLYIPWYNLVSLGFLGSLLQIWSHKIKIQDGWPNMAACCYKIPIKLPVVPMKYIFIHVKKGCLVTEKNDGMKNFKDKKEWNIRKWGFAEGLKNLFIYKKNLTRKKILKKICKFITYEDLVKFSWFYTQ